MPIQVRLGLTAGHEARNMDAMDGVGDEERLAGDPCVTGLFPLDTHTRI